MQRSGMRDDRTRNLSSVIASEAKQSSKPGRGTLDCFVAPLLAMTNGESVGISPPTSGAPHRSSNSLIFRASITCVIGFDNSDTPGSSRPWCTMALRE